MNRPLISDISSRQQTDGKCLRDVRHVALDMDGTIYNGKTLFKTTTPFLELLDDLNIGYTFLTNNPSKNADDYLAHLHQLGIKAARNQLYTSAHAAIEFFQQNRPQIKRLFVLGTPSLCEELKANGFTIIDDDSLIEPDAVLTSFDTTLTYPRWCKAAWWIKQGKPYFATNPDLVCPTDQPTVLIDCGSISAALEKATGRQPEMVFGKPDPTMLQGILRQHSLEPKNLAMVGDRLYTDITMARRAGVLGVLVLTGEATAAEAKNHAPAPDLIVPTLTEFGELLRREHPATIST